MKTKFDHKKGNIMESLDCSRDRMDKIVEGARLKMIKDSPTGTKSEQLESMLDECEDINEVVAATIVWVSMTGQMANRKAYDEFLEKKSEREFKDSLIMANTGLIKGMKGGDA